MKLTALKPLQRPGADDKPVSVSPGADFEVADASEAKRLIRSGDAKESVTAAAKAAPAPAPATQPAKP